MYFHVRVYTYTVLMRVNYCGAAVCHCLVCSVHLVFMYIHVCRCIHTRTCMCIYMYVLYALKMNASFRNSYGHCLLKKGIVI